MKASVFFSDLCFYIHVHSNHSLSKSLSCIEVPVSSLLAPLLLQVGESALLQQVSVQPALNRELTTAASQTLGFEKHGSVTSSPERVHKGHISNTGTASHTAH